MRKAAAYWMNTLHRRLLSEADDNDDGVVTYDEFAPMCFQVSLVPPRPLPITPRKGLEQYVCLVAAQVLSQLLMS